MRTLTLGVLIVSGGTLAALPFRRYHAIPDASTAPVQVTGPSHSALDAPESQVEALNSQATGEPSGPQVLATNLPQWPASVALPQRRRIDIPLSYEDLALPIDQPAAIEQQFSATTTVREKQLERERLAELVMPAMESLAVSQQQELEQATDAIEVEGSATPRASGSLASSSLSEQKIQRLPKAESVERDRHWIRQPN